MYYKEEICRRIINKIYKNNSIIIGGEDWHHGVIGIVSSKITDLYFKPSILLCFENEYAKGSRKKYTRF